MLRIKGMINFIGKFIPNTSARKSALKELLHVSKEFKWTVRNEQEGNALKPTLTNAPVLAYYDPTKRLKKSTDALKDGLGALLLQAEGDSWEPVACASRSMTKTETKYVSNRERMSWISIWIGNISLLCLWVSLSCQSSKSLNEMTLRTRHLIMKLQSYDSELIYSPGKYLVLADALSRAPVMSHASSTEQEIENHVTMIVESLPVSDVKTKVNM